MSITDDFKYVLEVIGMDEDHLDTMARGGFTRLSHLRTRDRNSLEEILIQIGIPIGVVGHVTALADWYRMWRTSSSEKKPIREALTEETWEDFLDHYDPATNTHSVSDGSSTSIQPSENNTSESQKTNSRFKLELKSIPKLPRKDSVQKHFTEWNTTFTATLALVQVSEILEEDFAIPDEATDPQGYKNYKSNDEILQHALIQATQGTTAYPYIDEDSTGRDNYLRLIKVYEGDEYKRKRAIDAIGDLSKLEFNRRYNKSADTFVAEFLTYLKLLKKNGTPLHEDLHESVFLNKITHPSLDKWVTVMKNKTESITLDEIYQKFREQCLELWSDGRSRNGDSHDGRRINTTNFSPRSLSTKEDKHVKKCIAEGKLVKKKVWEKLDSETKAKVSASRRKYLSLSLIHI